MMLYVSICLIFNISRMTWKAEMCLIYCRPMNWNKQSSRPITTIRSDVSNLWASAERKTEQWRFRNIQFVSTRAISTGCNGQLKTWTIRKVHFQCRKLSSCHCRNYNLICHCNLHKNNPYPQPKNQLQRPPSISL
mgnify:CR=1 FL=1